MSLIASTFKRLLREEGGWSRLLTPLAIGVCLLGGVAIYNHAGRSPDSCAWPNFPDASCTGVPSGVSLTAYTGPTTITTNDTVIDSKDITDCLTIQATGVVIKNSRIACDMNSSNFVVFLDDGAGAYDVTLQDDDILCTVDSGNSTAIGSAFITAIRVDISGCENGGDLNQGITVRDSYIHDLFQSSNGTLYPPDGTHTDGFQFASGHFTPPGGSTIVDGALNITLQHNTILSMGAGAHTPETDASYYTTSAIISNTGNKDTNIVITQNLLAGGSFTLYCAQGTGVYQGTSEVTNNHFSTRYASTVGFSGPSSDCADENISGNVYDETGLPVTMD